MCGIAGILGNPTSIDDLRSAASRMSAAIRHRGPDAQGLWSEPGVSLSQARLSIIDLSSAGSQPMVSHSSRYVVVFNGEIYNFKELRQELEEAGECFAGHSDTEVLLAGIEHWGLEKTLRRSLGMFALGLWDRESRRLTLARDRAGEKPLYYGWHAGRFLFSSELKAFRALEFFKPEIDPEAASLFFRYSYVPAPYSIFRGIRKMDAGAFMTIDPRQPGEYPRPVRYWSLEAVVRAAQKTPFQGSDEEAKGRLKDLLRAAVRGQMISDVPLGAFLSGGVDSSLIVSLMAEQATEPVKTFTVGFRENGFDESLYAKAVADHLGTVHSAISMTEQEAMSLVSDMPRLYDEPFSDPSQLPTYLVSKLARTQVTVSLSGDAGDELFGGYDRYRHAETFSILNSLLPFPARKAGKSVVEHGLLPLTAGLLKRPALSHKIRRAAEFLGSYDRKDIYLSQVSHWGNWGSAVAGDEAPLASVADPAKWPDLSLGYREQMMFVDFETYLPDDILVKVDRASMATGLESRVPFLDHRIIEFAWSLPSRMRLRDGQSKWLPKQLLYDYVPKCLVDRPKMGFGIPIDRWLKQGLRDWAESLLSEAALGRSGLLNVPLIRSRWASHLSGKENWHSHIWDVLMFQVWQIDIPL